MGYFCRRDFGVMLSKYVADANSEGVTVKFAPPASTCACGEEALYVLTYYPAKLSR